MPNPKYIELNKKLQSLKSFKRNFPDGSIDDNNGGLPPPSSTTPPSPLFPLLPAPPSVFNVSFLPTVPQFESKISLFQSEPTAKQQ